MCVYIKIEVVHATVGLVSQVSRAGRVDRALQMVNAYPRGFTIGKTPRKAVGIGRPGCCASSKNPPKLYAWAEDKFGQILTLYRAVREHHKHLKSSGARHPIAFAIPLLSRLGFSESLAHWVSASRKTAPEYPAPSSREHHLEIRFEP